MLLGPVFAREFMTAPRSGRWFVARAIYTGGLLLLVATAWLVLAGTQVVRNVGDMARFGVLVFQIIAPLQLALSLFFSALQSASAVSTEKDRRTLVLLLLTRLTGAELVLGKLAASMLNVVVLLAAAWPLFVALLLFGGVDLAQLVRVYAVTLTTALAAGGLGSTVALWREKTFQALAVTAVALVAWFVVWEIVRMGIFGPEWLGVDCQAWATAFSPWQAILQAARPSMRPDPHFGVLVHPVYAFMAFATLASVALNTLAIGRLRVWNPPREIQPREDEAPASAVPRGAEPVGPHAGLASDSSVDTPAPGAFAPEAATIHTLLQRRSHKAAVERTARPPGRTRRVWNNPVLWREVRTAAYGRKVLLVRTAYLVLFALAAMSLYRLVREGDRLSRTEIAGTIVPVFVLSLVLVNAQAVTSLTSERDAKALDLLLVTDLTPAEFVFGKLAGSLYNTKEMVLLPMAACIALAMNGLVSIENLVYLVGGLSVLYAFVATLGLHAGMTYANSRTAIAISLGTVFFLFLGIATCLRMMVAFSGSFQVQLQPFLAFMLGGGVGLYVALGARNPSTAIGIASLLCPFATFYAITSFLLEYTLAVFLVTVAMYGFATAAMLVPAIFEFDLSAGRTTEASQ